jgi:hypothetical protein
LAHDPRLFFVGAPSGLEGGFIANMLQRANKEARRSGGPSVEWISAFGLLCDQSGGATFPGWPNIQP